MEWLGSLGNRMVWHARRGTLTRLYVPGNGSASKFVSYGSMLFFHLVVAWKPHSLSLRCNGWKMIRGELQQARVKNVSSGNFWRGELRRNFRRPNATPLTSPHELCAACSAAQKPSPTYHLGISGGHEGNRIIPTEKALRLLSSAQRSEADIRINVGACLLQVWHSSGPKLHGMSRRTLWTLTKKDSKLIG